MSIGNRIRLRRESLGLSQDELAKRLGYKSRSSVNKIEIEDRAIPQNKIKQIAEILETTTDYIMGWEQPPIPMVNEFHEIPIYDALSCGIGGVVEEYAQEHFVLPLSMLKTNKEYFANYANGDSMIEEAIFDQDLLIFEKTQVLRNGDIGSFIIDDEAATCKTYYRDAKSGEIQLLPANSNYEPIIIHPQNTSFRILGKLALTIRNHQRS